MFCAIFIFQTRSRVSDDQNGTWVWDIAKILDILADFLNHRFSI